MPDAPRVCAGEGAALVAEQFGLHQIRRQRTAIDGDERPLATRRQGMQRTRRHFLAATGLAGDQHRQVHRRIFAQAGHRGAHHRALRGHDAGDIRLFHDRCPALAELRQGIGQALHVDRRREKIRTGAQDALHFRRIGGDLLGNQGQPGQPRMVGHQLAHRPHRIRIAAAQVGHGHHDIAAPHAHAAPQLRIADPGTPASPRQTGAFLIRRLAKPDHATPSYLSARHGADPPVPKVAVAVRDGAPGLTLDPDDFCSILRPGCYKSVMCITQYTRKQAGNM